MILEKAKSQAFERPTADALQADLTAWLQKNDNMKIVSITHAARTKGLSVVVVYVPIKKTAGQKTGKAG